MDYQRLTMMKGGKNTWIPRAVKKHDPGPPAENDDVNLSEASVLMSGLINIDDMKMFENYWTSKMDDSKLKTTNCLNPLSRFLVAHTLETLAARWQLSAFRGILPLYFQGH